MFTCFAMTCIKDIFFNSQKIQIQTIKINSHSFVSGKCDLTPQNTFTDQEKQFFSVATLIVVLLVIVIGCLSIFVIIAMVIGCKRKNPHSDISYKQLVQDDMDIDSQCYTLLLDIYHLSQVLYKVQLPYMIKRDLSQSLGHLPLFYIFNKDGTALIQSH